MKKYFLFQLLFIFVTQFSFAQEKSVQSEFLKAYKLYQKKDFIAALNIVSAYSKQKGFLTTEELTIQGFVFMDSISYDTSVVYFREALRQIRNSDDAKLRCKIYFGLGKAHYNTAAYKESISEFLEMEKIAVASKLKPEEKSANYYLAQDFQALNQIPVSDKYARRGMQLSLELNDTPSVFRNCQIRISNFVIKGFSTSNSGLLGLKKNDPVAKLYGDSAIEMINQLLIYTDTNNLNQMATVYDLYSGAYSCKTNYRLQVDFALQSYQCFLLSGDIPNAINTLSKTGSAYIDLEKYDSAIYYLKKSEQLKMENEAGLAGSDERVFNYDFYRAYKGAGDEPKALLYIEKYLKQDMELNEGRNIDLQKLREKFEAEKTRQHIEDEKIKTTALYEQKQRYFFLLYGAGLVFALLGARLFFMRMKSKKEKEKKNLQLLLQNAELTALKAQMNPHFIFNALNSIQHSVVTNNTDEAYRFLSKFSKLIRNILDSSAEQMIPLSTEIETLSLYAEIESKRFDNSFNFEMQSDLNGLDAEKIMVPPMIIQPFIENAIWHGLMPKEGLKELKVRFLVHNSDALTVEITDNGVGRARAKEISEKKKKQHKSRGLDIVSERSELLRRTLMMEVKAETEDLYDGNEQAAGTRVIISFKKINKAI